MDRTVILRFDARTLVLAGAIMVMVGVWLPWTNLPSFVVGDLARSGWASGGLFTFTLSILVALSLLLPWRPWGRVSMSAAILAVLINLIALAAFARIVQYAAVLEIDLITQLSRVGSGLYVTFAGAWLMLFGGLADGEPKVLGWNQGWMGYAAWAALAVVMLAACLCAWSIGLIVRPYTIDTGPQLAATFGPAPTAYLATPLVDVQLEPLGGVSPASTAVPGPIGAQQLTTTVNPRLTFTPVQVTARASLTVAPSSTAGAVSRTATPLPTIAQLPATATLPSVSALTSTPTLTSTLAPTKTPTRTPTSPSSPLPTSSSPLATPTSQ